MQAQVKVNLTAALFDRQYCQQYVVGVLKHIQQNARTFSSHSYYFWFKENNKKTNSIFILMKFYFTFTSESTIVQKKILFEKKNFSS